jgi:hypothetical protein
MTKQVDRVSIHDLTASIFRKKYRRYGIPVVITGLFDGIPDWNLEYLSETYGDSTFKVRHFGADRFSSPKKSWKNFGDSRRLSFNEYAELIRSGKASQENMYLEQVPIGGTKGGESIRDRVLRLGQICGIESLMPTIDLWMWVGPSGLTYPLHFDGGDGTLMQLHGSKHIVLFPPRQAVNLYPFPLFSPISPWVCQVDLANPDFDTFPRLRRALERKIEVTIGSGEVLYIPLMWAHEVTSLGDDYVCSVNRLWKVKPFVRNFCTVRNSILYASRAVPVAFRGYNWVMDKLIPKKPSVT